jgi:hypothetical protein
MKDLSHLSDVNQWLQSMPSPLIPALAVDNSIVF